MDDWRKEEVLKAFEKRKRMEELYGFNFKEISEKFSLMNESLRASINESLKAIQALSRLPKIEFPIPKYGLSIMFDRANYPSISKYLAQELGQISAISKNLSNNTTLKDLSRQYQSLTNSNLNTIIFANSLKIEELNLLKQYKFDLPEFPKINLPTQELSNLAKTLNQNRVWESLELLRNTYIGNIAISMREAIIDSSSKEEAIEKIESIYEEEVATLPQNHFLREFFLNQFFAVFLLLISLWYSNYLSQQSSAELKVFFGEVFTRLEKIENDGSQDEIVEDEVYYVVQRTVSVKNNPRFNSLTVDYLSPETKVRLMKTKHKWIYIEYIDNLEVIPRYGWISKKYLKRLEN